MTGAARTDRASVLIVGVAGLLAGLLAVLGAETKPLLPLAAIAGLGVMALAVLRPLWAIYLALLLIPLETVSASFTGFGLTPTELVILAAAGGWLIQRLSAGGESLRSPVTLPLVALLAAHVPALFLAVDRFAVLKELIMWTACFVLFLAVLADRGRATTEALLGVIAASAALVAAVAVVKSAGSQPVALDFGGIVTDRATGSFASPVLLAIFVAMSVPLQLVFMLRGRTRRVRLAGLTGTAISLTALGLALTRSAFIALAIVVVWLLVTWRPARRPALVLALLVGGVLLTKFNPVSSVLNTDILVQRITSISSGTHTGQLRLQIWEKSPEIIADNLPFGIGPKNFPKHAATYGLLFPAGAPSNAHDTLLTVASELGLPGLIVFTWLVIALARALIRSLRIPGEPGHSLAVGVTAAFLAIAVDGVFDYAYGDNAFFMSVILLIAAAARLERSARAMEPVAEAASGRPVAGPLVPRVAAR